MRRPKFEVGEAVEVRCHHRSAGQLEWGWVRGQVVRVDQRMAAIAFEVDVFSSNGWLIPDRMLWCAHGSPNARRPAEPADSL